jgi:hypothetical protein
MVRGKEGEGEEERTPRETERKLIFTPQIARDSSLIPPETHTHTQTSECEAKQEHEKNRSSSQPHNAIPPSEDG